MTDTSPGQEPKLTPVQLFGLRGNTPKPVGLTPSGAIMVEMINAAGSSLNPQTAALILGRVTFVIGSETSNKIRVTITLIDANGAVVVDTRLIEIWLADTSLGWETSTAASSFNIINGNGADTPTSNKHFRAMPDNGVFVFDVEYTGGAITWYVRVNVQGVVYTQAITFA